MGTKHNYELQRRWWEEYDYARYLNDRAQWCGTPGVEHLRWRATRLEDRPHQYVGSKDNAHHALRRLTGAGQASQDGVE